MPGFIDLTGHRYGRLLVLSKHGRDGEKITWNCQCDCGGTTVVRGNTLRNGDVVSCGCYHKERASQANTTHGLSDTPEHETWMKIIQRCTNPNVERFPHYGGRGITVCDRWKDSFPSFIADMGPRPSDEHSIERNDVNGNYEPNNCRWATDAEQARNRTNNKILEYQGESYIQKDLADKFGITHYQLSYHLNQGKTVEEAVQYLLEKKARNTD